MLDESSAGGVVTDLVFSGGTSVQEYAGSISSADLTVEYLRGSDYGRGVGGILYTLRGGTPSYTHENRRGDVVAKTDGSGSLTYQAQYEAFGNQTGTSGSTLDRQKSNSKDTDPTGLVAEGFRYRDLETGMFISRDPAGFVDGPNLYTYVVQNPWTHFDPEGLETEEAKAYEALESDPTVGDFAKDRAQRSNGVQAVGLGVANTITAVANATPMGSLKTAATGSDMADTKVSTGDRAMAVVGTVIPAASDLKVAATVVKDADKVATAVNDANKAASAATTVGESAKDVETGGATVTRYMSKGEADTAAKTGEIPNVGLDGKARPTHVTTDAPLDSAAQAQAKYELPQAPTHQATVPANRVDNLGPTPDGRATTSGGGSQSATSKPIPVKPSEIKPLNP